MARPDGASGGRGVIPALEEEEGTGGFELGVGGRCNLIFLPLQSDETRECD